MSDNWVVQNLENALETWNEKLAEIWQLLTQSPENFKGGTIWNVIKTINGTVQAIGLALLVLFFVVGIVKTCGSFAEVKKPEVAIKLFVRFALAKAVVTYGLELMMALFSIVQGVISTIMTAAGMGTAQQTVLPAEIVTAIEDCGFWESIPLWAVTLIGGLFITILSFIMILSVYGRFFKLYIYTATVLAVRHTGRVSFAGALRHTLFQQHSNGRRTTLIKNAIAPPIRNGVNSASTVPRKRKTASRFTSAHANMISSTSARVI